MNILKIKELRIEYKVTPLGIDEPCPRFSYRLEGLPDLQKTRRIILLDESGRAVWDSGIVESRQSAQIEYAGKEPLRPFTRYEWRVAVTMISGATAISEPAMFETGFMQTPWRAKWISGKSGIGPYRPATRLVREIKVRGGVRRARLYATALGLYTPFVNGRKITQDLFTPGWSQYFDHVQYQAYDVTEFLHPGANAVAALIGDGWFCGVISYVNIPDGGHGYGTHPLFAAELRIEYEDGSVETTVTDKSWSSVFLYPALLNNDIYLGEEYDAMFDDNDWKLPSFRQKVSSLQEAVEEKYETRIVWNEGAPVRVVRELKPVSVRHRPSGTLLLDFGENITGFERISLQKAHPGTVITVRHAEALDSDGNLYRDNLLFAKATTTLTCGREEGLVYSPSFTYYGFRYIEVSGWPLDEEFSEKSIQALVVCSQMERTGEFSCSNELVNKLYKNIIRSQEGNFLDVPTDCPQRCERFGWTGDAQVFAETAMLNFDTSQFFTKWIHDLDASRDRETGAFTVIAPDPTQRVSRHGGCAGWSDAGIVCPWMMYRKYGDTRVLKKYLPSMIAYIEHQDAQNVPSTIGDHLCLGTRTNSEFIARALLIEMIRRVAQIAEIVGDMQISETYRKKADERLMTFRAGYFSEDGDPLERTQTAAAMIILYDLAPGRDSFEKTRRLLVEKIKAHDTHLTTGFLGTPIILAALSKAKETALAYALLEQTSFPSWLYPVTQGATTIWERWDGWTEKNGFFDPSMNSFNHYAYGSVGAWFYSTICGINDTLATRHSVCDFRLAPAVANATMRCASATLKTPYGEIKSAWHTTEIGIEWSFTIPCNTTAEIVFPFAPPPELPSGIRLVNGKHIATPGTYCVSLRN